MRLALVIETINRVMDGRVESASIGEGAVRETPNNGGIGVGLATEA
jgi:hypothetical protein